MYTMEVYSWEHQQLWWILSRPAMFDETLPATPSTGDHHRHPHEGCRWTPGTKPPAPILPGIVCLGYGDVRRGDWTILDMSRYLRLVAIKMGLNAPYV